MPLKEILNGRWHISHLEIAAPAQLAGDILRNILGPALGRIEGDDADRAAVLAGEEILNNCFEVSGLVVGFAPRAADLPKIIGNEIHRLIAVSRYDRGRPTGSTLRHNRHSSRPEEFGSDSRYDRGRPTGSTHTQNSATTGIQADQRSLVRIVGGVESPGVCWSMRRNRQACSGSIPQGCSGRGVTTREQCEFIGGDLDHSSQGAQLERVVCLAAMNKSLARSNKTASGRSRTKGAGGQCVSNAAQPGYSAGAALCFSRTVRNMLKIRQGDRVKLTFTRRGGERQMRS